MGRTLGQHCPPRIARGLGVRVETVEGISPAQASCPKIERRPRMALEIVCHKCGWKARFKRAVDASDEGWLEGEIDGIRVWWCSNECWAQEEEATG